LSDEKIEVIYIKNTWLRKFEDDENGALSSMIFWVRRHYRHDG